MRNDVLCQHQSHRRSFFNVPYIEGIPSTYLSVYVTWANVERLVDRRRTHILYFKYDEQVPIKPIIFIALKMCLCCRNSLANARVYILTSRHLPMLYVHVLMNILFALRDAMISTPSTYRIVIIDAIQM